MYQIGRISFVDLTIEIHDKPVLEKLPSFKEIVDKIALIFSPFSVDDALETSMEFRKINRIKSNKLHLIYLYGHAWIGKSGPEVAVKANNNINNLNANELLEGLLGKTNNENMIIIFDCCHAEAFDEYIRKLKHLPLLCVYTSGSNENAIASNLERTTRFLLHLSTVLGKYKKIVDLVQVIADVSSRLNKDDIITGQTVSYRMCGSVIRLQKGNQSLQKKRERTVLLKKYILIISSVLFSIVTLFFIWFYWSHVFIEIDLNDLQSITNRIVLVISKEEPDDNISKIIIKKTITGKRHRLWISTGDIILRIKGEYKDNKERAISFHLIIRPGFNLSSKLLTLSIPSAKEVSSKSKMAYIPSTKWLHGQEINPLFNKIPFWIDIRPPTIREYYPIVLRFVTEQKINIEDSFILKSLLIQDGIKQVGLESINKLSNDLGEIFGFINSATFNNIAAPGNICFGLTQLSDKECPAPMTYNEAEIYCQDQGKRVPNDLEWELAVRGVDGRIYPWGNRINYKYANIPGLPQKGSSIPQLKPVKTYNQYPSPFGLIDTVGNAGDWIKDENGTQLYMGATYRYNPEDATAFRKLPTINSDSIIREITVRCVSNSDTK